PPRVRNGVLAAQPQRRGGQPQLGQRLVADPHHQVPLVLRHPTGPLAGNRHRSGPRLTVGDRDLDPVVAGQRHAQGVEPRAEVGRGSRHGDPHRGKRKIAHTSSSAFATACGSTGSGSTSVMLDSAVSGSFNPCPVTVHTTTEPDGKRPSSAVASRPATLAAEAGSTNTPSREASSRYAARISSSVTAANRPFDSSLAVTAFCQDAGLPTRMAVATVSGFSTGWPCTSGAAPAAWKPNMRGVRSIRPSRAYSW